MINFMFWNTGLNEKKRDDIRYNNINEAITQIIKKYDIDFIVLAEYDYDESVLSDILATVHRDFKVGPFASDSRVKLLIDNRLSATLIRDSGYYFVCQIEYGYIEFSFLLSGVHFPSHLHGDAGDNDMVSRALKNDINEAVTQVNQEKCIIVGDFNLNPFDNGMIQCDALHAIPYSSIVKSKKKRSVRKKEYSLFYNPMWNFLGDFAGRGYTYYYNSSTSKNLYHYIYDQVLMSPEMIKYFIPNSLEILNEVSDISLINKRGHPNRNQYSDHLPIIFSLEEEML